MKTNEPSTFPLDPEREFNKMLRAVWGPNVPEKLTHHLRTAFIGGCQSMFGDLVTAMREESPEAVAIELARLSKYFQSWLNGLEAELQRGRELKS